MSEWVPVGEIALLQIQTAKVGDGLLYRPHPITATERLRLTPRGVYGLVGGSWILDRHHRDHPDADGRWSEHRTLSVGFTSHYAHMWEQFRSTPIGSAGENVLVDADSLVSIGEIDAGVRIEGAGGQIELAGAVIAEPCIPFTRFMTDRPEADSTTLKPEREKLRNGIRGFVVGLHGIDRLEISPGDKLSIRGAQA